MSRARGAGVRNLVRRAAAGPARSVLRAAVRLTPKHESVVIATYPDFEDSLRALLPHLRASAADLTILLSGTGPRPTWVPDDVRCAPIASWEGLRRYLRAPVVFGTHGLYGSPDPVANQLLVNLWHGMPLKSIAPGRERNPSCSFTISTAPVFNRALAESFRLRVEDVEVTGLPRNDVLVDPEVPDGEVIRRELGVRGYLVMLPTYRVAVLGAGRVDSSNDGLDMPPAQRARLDEILVEHDLALIAKPHPLASPTIMDSWRSDRVHVINDAWLSARSCTVYGLLGGADLLISDYSSVLIDWVVTERVCILFQPDKAEYRDRRGINLSEDELATLGEVVTDLGAMVEAIAAAADRGFVRSGPPAAGVWTVPPSGATERVLAAVARRRRARSR